jgi:hypothetical protein
MKLNELSSRTGQLIERIAASRITELEITRSLFGMFLGGEAANTLDDDVAQLRAILEGGKRPPDCDPLK